MRQTLARGKKKTILLWRFLARGQKNVSFIEISCPGTKRGARATDFESREALTRQSGAKLGDVIRGEISGYGLWISHRTHPSLEGIERTHNANAV